MSKSKSVDTFILLDRSGSMITKWGEALGSVSAYVNELKDNKVAGNITVAAFDAVDGLHFQIMRDKVAVKKYKPLTKEQLQPRGMTPLFDAIGRLVSLAEKNDSPKTVLVIMTDGAENCSREVTHKDAIALMDKCKKKDWQVTFLGADFTGVHSQAMQLGMSTDQVQSMQKGNYDTTLSSVAGATVRYSKGE